MLRAEVLLVRRLGSSVLEMRPRAINPAENIVRRPTQNRETQGLIRVGLVNGKVPNATPYNKAMACARDIIAPPFIILEGRSSPLWRGRAQISTRSLRRVYVGHRHIAAVDALRLTREVHGTRNKG